MFKLWTKLGIAALGAVMVLAPLSAAAQRRMRAAPAPAASPVVVQRFVVVRPGWYYDPWWGWGWAPAYAPYAQTNYAGTVKIEHGDAAIYRDASLYIDGGYAGRADKLKKFDLPPGTHTIELRDSDGRRLHEERVHVIAGKTVKIHLG